MKNNHNRWREHHVLGREIESVKHVLEREGCRQRLPEKQVGKGLVSLKCHVKEFRVDFLGKE